MLLLYIVFLIYKVIRFLIFLLTHLLYVRIGIEGYQDMPVHFVGSIAFHFIDILARVANEYGCELGSVDRQPIYKLLEWHERTQTAV